MSEQTPESSSHVPSTADRLKSKRCQETRARGPRGRRLWLFRFVALVIVPAFFLLLLELVLRLVSYGYDTHFVEYAEVQGEKVIRDNPAFAWRFFSPGAARHPQSFRLPAQKAEKTIRIVLLGESAAMGDPEPAFGMARELEVMLEKKYPDTDFEVWNTGVVAISSHVVREIADDCTEHEPDIYISYIGNNEVVGPYGPGTAFSPLSKSLSVIRFNMFLKSTRTGQLLNKVATSIGVAAKAPQEWKGMELFINNHVTADSPRLQVTYSHFRNNLNAIVHSAQSAHVPMLMCTVGSNLRDCAPFGSSHREDLASTEKTKWESLFNQGDELQKKGDWEKAIEQFNAALEIDDRFADLSYRLGQCYLALGEPEKAKEYYLAARELDTLRFRAENGINNTTREVALKYEGQGVTLLDIEKIMEDASPNGIPGRELFWEHVHMTFEGNYVIASAMMGELDKILANHFPEVQPAQDELPSIEECKFLLGYNDYMHLRIVDDVLTRMKAPPFTYQSNYQDEVVRYIDTSRLLADARRPPALKKFIEQYKEALDKRGFDWRMLSSLSEFYFFIDDFQKSAETMEQVVEYMPNYHGGLSNLGVAYDKMERYEDAIAAYRKCRERNYYARDVRMWEGQALAHLEKYDEAFIIYESEADFHSIPAKSDREMGEILLQKNRLDDAKRYLERSLEKDSTEPATYKLLSKLYEALGKPARAKDYAAKAEELTPADAIGEETTAGIALLQKGKLEEAIAYFEELLGREPEDAVAWNHLAIALASSGRVNDAEEAWIESLRLRPDYHEAYNNYGVLLKGRGELDKAIWHFQKAFELSPGYADARINLENTLKQKAYLESKPQESNEQQKGFLPIPLGPVNE